MFKHFRGRIIQVLEALIVSDGVSNQLLSMHKLLESEGLNSLIYTRFHDDDCALKPNNLNDLVCNTNDILIYHYCGITESLDLVFNQPCRKIFIYHNITPKVFFEKNSEMYLACEKARQNLREIIKHFDFFVGISQYNLKELLNLGVPKEKTAVFPIIIENSVDQQAQRHKLEKSKITWLFVGRLARNKDQLSLIELFAKAISKSNKEHELLLVGDINQDIKYAEAIKQKILNLNLHDEVKLLGKIPDDELEAVYFTADVYISVSKHEGFGIPLIEACAHQIPVLALNYAAISEVLENSPGVVNDEASLLIAVKRLFLDDEFRKSILRHQKLILKNHSLQKSKERLRKLLQNFIPKKYEYKTVSIVICTYNRGSYLARALDYLQYQTNRNFEVVIINGPSDDNTEEVLKPYQKFIKYGVNPSRNLSISRNMGIALASGDIVAFIDDDAIPFDNWVDTLLNAFNGSPYGTAGLGGATYYAGTLNFQLEDHAINKFANTSANCAPSQFLIEGEYRGVLGTNCAFLRKDLVEINGFDEQYDYFLDETDICLRLQLEKKKFINYQPNLFLRHEFAQSCNRASKHNYNWFSICKNIAYYIVKFNPDLAFSHQFDLIKNQIEKVYINRIENAYKNNEISAKEMYEQKDKIYFGMLQGINDAKSPRKYGEFENNLQGFMKFNLVKNVFPEKIKALHVVIITEEFSYFTQHGGIGTLYYQLTCELIQIGHKVSVIIPADTEMSHKCGNFNLYKIPLKSLIEIKEEYPTFSSNMNKAANISLYLNELHEEQPIDIVEFALWDHLGISLFLNDNFKNVLSVLRLVTPYKIAAECNNWCLNDTNYFLEIQAEKFLINNVDVVIPISKSIESTLLSAYDLRKDTRWQTKCFAGMAYWPVFDVNTDYKNLCVNELIKPKLLSAKKKILFLGRLESRKNIFTFLAAAKYYLDKHKDNKTVFIVVGRDIENVIEKFQEEATEYQKDNVLFLGQVDNITKEKLYAHVDVVVFPSLYESFGFITLEAFVHGKPVIGAKAGAIPEVIEHNKNGLLFNPADPIELMAQIELLLSDNRFYKKLSKGAQERVYQLSARNMAIETLKIYHGALTKRKKNTEDYVN